MEQVITQQDRRRWANQAYRMGHRDPDMVCPYKPSTPSREAWRLGRADRLEGKPLALPFPKEN